jgi:hypothetical protein
MRNEHVDEKKQNAKTEYQERERHIHCSKGNLLNPADWNVIDPKKFLGTKEIYETRRNEYESIGMPHSHNGNQNVVAQQKYAGYKSSDS